MKLKEFQKRVDVDYTVFTVQEHLHPSFVYFSGIDDLTHATLVVPRNGKGILYVSALDYGRVSSLKGLKVVLQKKKLSAYLPKSKKFGVDYASTSAALLGQLRNVLGRPVDVGEHVRALRIVKSAKEISLLKKAAAIADTAFTTALSRGFRTEHELKAALEYEILKQGAVPSFPTIIGAGKNGAVPHYVTGRSPLKGFCVIDFGARYKGYCSDCTRTVFFGKPSAKDVGVYSNVLRAQQGALDMVRDGVEISSLERFVRKKLGKLENYFTHSLGHGIGIEVHEAPGVSSRSTGVLDKGMVITIEPGVYLPGTYGIRIEDTVVVGKKSVVLTKLSKELLVL